jgi:hypothetical protein
VKDVEEGIDGDEIRYRKVLVGFGGIICGGFH